MKAIFYSTKPIQWVTCQLLKHFWPGCLTTRLNGISLQQAPKPALPGDDWVSVRTLMGGICGSDLAVLTHKYAPNSLLQAFSSQPSIFGHENVAVVDQVGGDVDKSWLGKRVCVEPTLCCQVRGIDPPCDRCRAGDFGACENFAAAGLGRAKLPAGTSIGYNSATGGSFGEYFVAHQSQLVEVPPEISDELAVLTDPIACGLHSVLRADLTNASSVLVYGAGMLGLAIIASLRATGYQGEIHVIDRHEYLGDLAQSLGASKFLRLPADKGERFARIAELTGATVQRARFDNYMLSGGYDVVFECVGAEQSLDASLKWTAARGQVVLVATGSGQGADLTPIWFRELTVIGAYGRSVERFNGERMGTYQLVHKMMTEGKLDLRALLTHTFDLKDYRLALDAAINKPARQAVKVAFDFR